MSTTKAGMILLAWVRAEYDEYVLCISFDLILI